MEAGSYGSHAMDGNAARGRPATTRPSPDAGARTAAAAARDEPPGSGRLGGFARRRGTRGGVEARPAAVRRGGDVVVAAERLGELRRLAIADAVGDLAHGQAAPAEHLGGALHPDRREVVAERRAPDLGVRALELAARGRDAARDVVEREVRGVLGLDDGGGVLVEAGAVTDGGRAVHEHRCVYGVSFPHG